MIYVCNSNIRRYKEMGYNVKYNICDYYVETNKIEYR